MSKLSIVIPVYYNELNLKPLYNDIKEKILNFIDFDYEIVFVDDGSKDKSWDVICELSKIDPNIVAVKLSRNFGSHAAVLCGLSHCTGDCAVVKAADLQEPTELILEMHQKWKDGFNVVLAIRKDREDKSFFSSFYYWLVRKFAIETMPENGFDVYLIDKKVIGVLKQLDEINSALTCQILWSGFKTAKVDYIRKKREIGKSRWSIKKKVRLVTDTMFSFSNLPVSLIGVIGVFSCIGAAIWAVIVLIGNMIGQIPVEGFTTLMIFQLFSFGIIMLTLAIIGNYIWRIFDASRNRPVYIIDDIKKTDR